MNNFVNKLYINGMLAKDRLIKAVRSERGEANIVAIILVLAIVIALAIVFRGAIKSLFDTIWAGITGDVSGATGKYAAE